MRKTNADEIKANESCLTCEANAVCEPVKGIAQSDRSKYICKQYANTRKGFQWDANRARIIEE
jgi:hypothetical protein